jgi:hypothetical protein
MLDFGGSFHTFFDALFNFLNTFLSGVFGWLTDLINGINVNIT